ncbi:MAG: hypothetical protein KDN19_04310 [Verrucomicrobiae bacterium]|nr:hypothetical protein [Verrucomicrobiae bacterium]
MKRILLCSLALSLSSCSNTRTVQFTINSEPQGAYTTFEFDSPTTNKDAQFLGNTPISITREIDIREVPGNAEVTLRAMLPGYFDGTKIYTMKAFLREAKTKGGIFWNFDLVPSNRSE